MAGENAVCSSWDVAAIGVRQIVLPLKPTSAAYACRTHTAEMAADDSTADAGEEVASDAAVAASARADPVSVAMARRPNRLCSRRRMSAYGATSGDPTARAVRDAVPGSTEFRAA